MEGGIVVWPIVISSRRRSSVRRWVLVEFRFRLNMDCRVRKGRDVRQCVSFWKDICRDVFSFWKEPIWDR